MPSAMPISCRRDRRGLSGRQPLDEALAGYERAAQRGGHADVRVHAATRRSEPPRPEMQQLFAALRGNQEQTNRFFGTIAGTVPIPEFFSPENIGRIMMEAGAQAAAV